MNLATYETSSLFTLAAYLAVRTFSRVLRDGLVQEHKQIPPLVRVYLLQLETQIPHLQLPVLRRFQLSGDGDVSVVACDKINRTWCNGN